MIGEAGYANTVKPVNTITNFGCAGRVPNYYAAGCVKWGPTGPRSTDVSLIMAPWNPRKSAYDCSLADPEYYRASCCAENFLPYGKQNAEISMDPRSKDIEIFLY
ncbi:hypothetical protein PSTT_11568 [Puccinia striiformis]|uniref:Uncharacterized protein n=1 Tax=Puccinia striiformis TaxID=27350 RepID=A0A2S4UZF0_9BASI|nr:hypothetical protein PSTT_11568 [Puccinia striiformis]